MEPLPTARRRTAALTIAVLCLLTALTGAVVRSAEPGHHHGHVLGIAAAAPATASLLTTPARSIDAAPAAATAPARLALAHVGVAADGAAGGATDPGALRNRGPPAA